VSESIDCTASNCDGGQVPCECGRPCCCGSRACGFCDGNALVCPSCKFNVCQCRCESCGKTVAACNEEKDAIQEHNERGGL